MWPHINIFGVVEVVLHVICYDVCIIKIAYFSDT